MSRRNAVRIGVALGSLIHVTACGPAGSNEPAAAPSSSTSTTAASTTVAPTTVAPTTSIISSVPDLPDASPGPFEVGHTTLVLPAEGSRPLLNVDVWYPSEGAAGTPARYPIAPAAVPAVAVDARLATTDPPVATGSFPLVVYSHGSGGFRVVATFFTEVLASHGYVVAAVDHPGDTIVESILRALADDDLDLGLAVQNRIVDLQRTIDGVVAASATSTAPFAGSVDADWVVLAGHSLGGAGALRTAAVDDRIDALILMDPSWFTLTDETFDAIDLPTLVMEGDGGIGEATTNLGADMDLFDVKFPSASHLSFTDICAYEDRYVGWIAAGAPAELGPFLEGRFRETCRPPVLDADRSHDLVDGYSLAFLNLVTSGEPQWRATLEAPRADAELLG